MRTIDTKTLEKTDNAVKQEAPGAEGWFEFAIEVSKGMENAVAGKYLYDNLFPSASDYQSQLALVLMGRKINKIKPVVLLEMLRYASRNCNFHLVPRDLCELFKISIEVLSSPENKSELTELKTIINKELSLPNQQKILSLFNSTEAQPVNTSQLTAKSAAAGANAQPRFFHPDPALRTNPSSGNSTPGVSPSLLQSRGHMPQPPYLDLM